MAHNAILKEVFAEYKAHFGYDMIGGPRYRNPKEQLSYWMNQSNKINEEIGLPTVGKPIGDAKARLFTKLSIVQNCMMPFLMMAENL